MRIRSWFEPLRFVGRYHGGGSLLILLAICWVVALQVSDRRNFANSELYRDVIERWGAPIVQPMPSVRVVPSGAVFTRLQPLPIAEQRVRVDATMNYRKRGLVYFSGFDFTFDATYTIRNDEAGSIDAVFVFPVQLEKNKVLLSDLSFRVDGQPAPVDLNTETGALTWTGRLAPGGEATFAIRFRGRGLDSFVYQLDPSLPVRGFALEVALAGGDTYDYPGGVVPATTVRSDAGQTLMRWEFASLESGVPVGVVLPAERSYDGWIVTMVKRAWAPFLVFLAALAAIASQHGRLLHWYQAYLIAAAFGFFFILLAYLAAFMNFYVAYTLATAIIALLIAAYIDQLYSRRAAALALGALLGSLTVPTAAVMLEGYTGLIYSLEILAGLALLMLLTTRASFQELVGHVVAPTEVTNG